MRNQKAIYIQEHSPSCLQWRFRRLLQGTHLASYAEKAKELDAGGDVAPSAPLAVDCSGGDSAS